MITISIDVTLLDKTRFKQVKRKNGDNAVFADLILIETPDGKYGDYIVKQGVTKEERAARIEMPILGNGKKLHTGKAQSTAASAPQAPEDGVPF